MLLKDINKWKNAPKWTPRKFQGNSSLFKYLK